MIYKGLELKPIRNLKKGELWNLIDKKYVDIFEIVDKKIQIVLIKRKFLILSV